MARVLSITPTIFWLQRGRAFEGAEIATGLSIEGQSLAVNSTSGHPHHCRDRLQSARVAIAVPLFQWVALCERSRGFPWHPAARVIQRCQRTCRPVVSAIGLKYETRRVHRHVGDANGRNDPVAPAFRRSQTDEHDLVLGVIDDRLELGFEPNLFHCAQIALEDGKLQVIAEILARLEHASQPFVVGNVIADQIGDAHGSTGG